MNLRNKINGITDASATKVYAVLVAGGTYKPTTGTDRTISFSMKNHVALIGGFDATGSWELTVTTTFSGDIGTANDNIDNTYNVFRHHRDPLNNAVLYGVTVTGGNADDFFLRDKGGGMYNTGSSPRLFNVVFTGNHSLLGGAGMYNNNDGTFEPLIVNTIFAGNTASGIGQDIAMRLDTSAGETIRIAGSVLGIGMNNHPTNAIVGVDNTNRSINLTYHSLANGAVNFGPNATLGGLTYPTIQSSSSAVNVGLYMRRDGNNYYFSEDKATWYTNFTATGGFGAAVNNLPAGAEDLTARDIAGNTRVGRPDAGVYEYKP